MKIAERNVMRLVAVQHLRAAYGIKTKNWNKNKAASSKWTASNSVSLRNKNKNPSKTNILKSINREEVRAQTHYCADW